MTTQVTLNGLVALLEPILRGPVGVNPTGAWSAGTKYYVHDLALYGGGQYLRLVEGTTSGTPAADATNWQLFLAGTTGAATTVSALPAASSVAAGTRMFVTDATASTFLSIVAGGGSVKTPVTSDGTNWLIG